uniref:RNA polymerase Rpb4/RPC9 core domain-containing protein n=1 Tax=Monodelphis domestica TaxID=13616 RepID=A0A5F8HLA7_MONDO
MSLQRATVLLSNNELFQLLTDLKEQRKECGKNKHSSGQQSLNIIMYETMKYLLEESEERLTEEQIEDLLQTITSILPGDPEAEQKTENMAVEEGDPE